jgi:hypothetical protein
MANLGLPVPPGFTITTAVCTHYYENGNAYPKNLQEHTDLPRDFSYGSLSLSLVRLTSAIGQLLFNRAIKPHGSSPTRKTMGSVLVTALTAKVDGGPAVTITAAPLRTRSVASSCKTIRFILGPAVYDSHVVALDVPALLQTLTKSAQSVRHGLGRSGIEIPDERHRPLLRACREGPRRRGAEKRKERAPSHSITRQHLSE